ncbi:hypothetical protein SAMN05192580_3555 [Sphingomonas jatrophae]|uniref:Uncharacterized protein n=1 Tax=Sphingomonas jatrophae TaxID=1166337 RepID=A0A1I6M6M8_9SPHN|nr:hypothetical protein SAMN05192580_3555 [Sphingomonas jatrophae]
MEAGGFQWSLLTILGPILLAAVLLWALVRNRAQKGGKGRTEAATRDLYEAQDRQDKAEANKVQR